MRLAEDQLRVLEENFSRGGRNPDGATLALIAAECGLSEEETLVGFCFFQYKKSQLSNFYLNYLFRSHRARVPLHHTLH